VPSAALVYTELPPLKTVVPAEFTKVVPRVKSPVTFPPSGSDTVALKFAGLALIIPVGERLVGVAGLLLATTVRV